MVFPHPEVSKYYVVSQYYAVCQLVCQYHMAPTHQCDDETIGEEEDLEGEVLTVWPAVYFNPETQHTKMSNTIHVAVL